MKRAATKRGTGKRKPTHGLVGATLGRTRRLPDKRTFRVLLALVVGMTAISSVLMFLDPGPVHQGPGVALSALELDDPRSIEEALFSTKKTLSDEWQYIIIHDSRGQAGSVADLERFWDDYYTSQGLSPRGAGYHFVVNDASGKADGEIEVCQRWQEQYPGGYIDAEGDDHWNRIAIGVCVMGDADVRGFSDHQMSSLSGVVRELQRKFNIPRERVIVQVGASHQPAAYFPEAQFRRGLID